MTVRMWCMREGNHLPGAVLCAEAWYMMDHFDSDYVADNLNQVLNQRYRRGKKYILRTSPGAKFRARHRRGQNFCWRFRGKSLINQDILDEDDHLMNFVLQTKNYGSDLPFFVQTVSSAIRSFARDQVSRCYSLHRWIWDWNFCWTWSCFQI